MEIIHPWGGRAWLPTPSVTFFQRRPVERGSKKVTSHWRDLTNTTSSHVAKVNITVISHFDNMYPWDNMMKMMFYISGLISVAQTHHPQSNGKKNTRLILYNNWGTFYKIPDQYFSKPSRSSKTKQVWETFTTHRRLRRHDDCNRKIILGKSWGNLNKVWTSVTNYVQYWLINCEKYAILIYSNKGN